VRAVLDVLTTLTVRVVLSSESLCVRE
jgi:hypothetical protein